jgi:hypothetical protein
MQTFSLDLDLAAPASRDRTLVVAIAPDASQRAILDACRRAGVATAATPDAVRGKALDRVIVFGAPAETAVLQVAFHLGARARTVGIVWDATYGDSDLTLALTRDRATQAGVIPYTLAAFIAELRLDLPTTTSRPRYAEVA